MSVEVEIRHRFGAFALDVAFKTERAGVTALFGPSGAGKTSIVNAVAGLLRPDEGRIVIAGRVVLDTGAGVFVPARARRTGYVFQDSRLFPHMNVEDNLRFGWRRAPQRMDEHEIEHVVEMLGLTRLLERDPKTLSGGEKGASRWRARCCRRRTSCCSTSRSQRSMPRGARRSSLSRAPARRDEAADVLCQPHRRRGRAAGR